jgi:hypothetical protein
MLNEWMLCVFHVWSSNSGTGSTHPETGIYTKEGKFHGGTDFRWRTDNQKSIHRVFLYYSDTLVPKQYLCYPRVDIVDGTEPTIDDLLNGRTDRLKNLSPISTSPLILDWSDENNFNLGLTLGGTLHVASRWPSDKLNKYNNYYLTKIHYFLTSQYDNNNTIVIHVWKGTETNNAPSIEITGQTTTNNTSNSWNTIELDQPIKIDINDDLWFGYSITHNSDKRPVGCDDGPANEYRGDMVSIGGGPTGTTWVSISNEYGVDRNFNIQGEFIRDPYNLMVNGNELCINTNYNSSINISGLNQYIETDFGKGWNFNNDPVTICAWIKSDVGGGMWVDWGSNGTNQRLYSGINTTVNRLGIENSYWSSQSPSGSVSWRYQVIVFTGSLAKAYNNGQYLFSKSYSSSFRIDGNLNFGGRIVSIEPFNSQYMLQNSEFGHISIYKKALSDSEILHNYEVSKRLYDI